MSEYTPTTDHVREVFSNRPGGDYVKQRLEFNRWLWAYTAKLFTEFMQQPEFQEMLAARDTEIHTAALAQAWDEGHETWWKRGPDDCQCGAWSSSECGCGLYGSGELLSLADNPYRAAKVTP